MRAQASSQESMTYFDPAGLDDGTIEAFCRRIDTLEREYIDLLNRVTILEQRNAPPE